MGYRKDLKSYLNLSRKELQALCKNNNLPANRSHTHLAKSLAIFFKNKNASPVPLTEKSISLLLDTKPQKSEHLSKDKSKGIHERRTHFMETSITEKEGDDRQHSLNGNLMAFSSHINHQAWENAYATAPKQYDCSTSKSGNCGWGPSVAVNIQQIEKDTTPGSEWNIGGTLNDITKFSEQRNKCQMAVNHAASKSKTHNTAPTVMPSAAKSSRTCGFLSSEDVSTKETPLFQFFVMCEGGIDLHVNLNSIPSEWINSLKHEVQTNLKLQDSMSVQADVRTQLSPFENTGRVLDSNRVDINSGCTTSTLSSDSENCQSVVAQPDTTFASSDSSVLTSISIPVIMPGYLDGATLLSDHKHIAFDSSSCHGDGNSLSEGLVDASCGMEKINASVIGFSMGPISEGTTNEEQTECPILNIDHNLNTNGLGKSLESIHEENNNYPISDGTGKTVFSDMGNLEKDSGACKASIERGPVVRPLEVPADHDRPLNQMLDLASREPHSDATSADYILNCHVFSPKNSVTKDPVSVLNHELGKITQAEGKEISECSEYRKSSENNSKRSHSPESQEEYLSKRLHSYVENKTGIIVNLRSTRTSAKETILEHVVRPRRSTRLLK